MASCTHQHLRFDSTDWGAEGYRQPPADEIQDALRLAAPKKRKKTASALSGKKAAAVIFPLPSAQTFPAPLVEEDDELYHDPDYPSQSLQEWHDEEARNKVTAKRRIIYIVPPPETAPEVGFVEGWTSPSKPAVRGKRKVTSPSPGEEDAAVRVPGVEDVAAYLRAFYHGMPVEVLEKPVLRLNRWDDGDAEAKTTKSLALETDDEAIRLRCRPSPDSIFPGQLNLDDLLDGAIGILRDDAYALLILVHHDLYEDENDDFCCGRAYGGSRVAVVSSARYRPELDARQGVDREHSWPASHCDGSSGRTGSSKKTSNAKVTTARERYPDSAIAAAVDAFNAIPRPTTAAALSSLWLGRICKTVSHELGHCFGIDHCTYYACAMQGTANVGEDARQPPYLCPVDLAKVLAATGAEERERYEALVLFCEGRGGERMFAGFAAWVRARLRQGGNS